MFYTITTTSLGKVEPIGVGVGTSKLVRCFIKLFEPSGDIVVESNN